MNTLPRSAAGAPSPRSADYQGVVMNLMKKIAMATVPCGVMILMLTACASTPAAIAPTPQSAWSGWRHLTDIDSMSGEVRETVVAAWSENEISGSTRNGKVMVGLWCAGDMYIHTGLVGSLHANHPFYKFPAQDMRYAFDNECCETQMWEVWEGFSVASLRHGTGDSIIRGMMEHSRFSLEVQMGASAGQRLEFDLTGFNEAYAACS